MKWLKRKTWVYFGDTEGPELVNDNVFTRLGQNKQASTLSSIFSPHSFQVLHALSLHKPAILGGHSSESVS